MNDLVLRPQRRSTLHHNSPERPMRYVIMMLFVVGCSSIGSQSEAPQPANSLPAGNYELRGNDAAVAAGMPALHFELGQDGMLRVTEAGVLHVRTLLTQSAGDELEFRDQDGPRACRNPQPIPGRYRAERTPQGWRLHVISDACDPRKGALDGGIIVITAR